MFRVAGVLLEADWFESLENVGNESENLPSVNVCSYSTAGVAAVYKPKSLKSQFCMNKPEEFEVVFQYLSKQHSLDQYSS